MKNIKAIFRGDMKALFTNFFVLVIALALCVLPALYAWFNIYSNWDPYGNTGNIKIAIATEDLGYIDESGENVNASQKIIDNVLENTSIKWIEMDAEKAVDGVKSGKYYAAVVFSEEFTKCMYDGFFKDLKRPEVRYYENEKKNAVATKITDTAVSNLENNINETYISVLVKDLFEQEAGSVNTHIGEVKVEQFREKLERVKDNVTGYEKLIDSFTVANEKLNSSLDNAKSDLGGIGRTAASKSAELKDASNNHFGENILKKDRQVKKSLTSAMTNIEKAVKAEKTSKKNTYYNHALAYLKDAKTGIDNMLNSMKVVSLSNSEVGSQYNRTISILENQLSSIDSFIQSLSKNLSKDKNSYTSQQEAMWEETLQDLEDEYEEVLQPFLSAVSEYVNVAARDASNALNSIEEDLELLEVVLAGAQDSITNADEGLSRLSDGIHGIADRLNKVDEKIVKLSSSELVKKFAEFLQGDPSGYGAFFSSPVTIDTKPVYPVENYGSGVTPFYTTLALWVGGIFLVAIIKVNPTKEKYNNPKPYEMFLGRFILFFLLGQLQTIIIVLGNICLLHTQCISPIRFWFASSVASFTFMLLIYSLTVSFGDIGKALVVVLVVIQIAGSSGTYPIEILPEFYQKIYIFFPFPYSINAMREAICGAYESDYVIYLLKLLLFAVAALLLGLLIRLPFMKVSHFVERRMEDTGFM